MIICVPYYLHLEILIIWLSIHYMEISSVTSVDILISIQKLNFRLYSTSLFRISVVSDAASNGGLDR